MARTDVERFLRDFRSGDALVAVAALFLRRKEFEFLADHHAVRHPERKSCADIGREGEELEVAADLAMVALFHFLEPVEVVLQFLLVSPCGAVDALKLRVLGIAAPIGAGDLGQLEGVADLGRVLEVRPAAQVVPVAVVIDRDIFSRRNALDQLGLVGLADVLEMLDRLVARPHFARGRQAGLHDLMHLGFDLRQVFGRKRLLAREVVIEAVVDRRTDGHLGARIEILHRHGQDMRGVVADQLQRLRVLPGDDADLGVPLDGPEQVPFRTVDFEDQCRLGEAGADGGCDLRAGHALGKSSVFPSGSVMRIEEPAAADMVLSPYGRAGGPSVNVT